MAGRTAGSTGPTGSRPARADAVRNRSAILDAAREQITRHGPDVGMDQIAAAAGVAVGTLYRHFPTKTDLVTAVLSAFVAQVADLAEAAAARVDEGQPAFAELAGLLGDIVEEAASNQAAKAAARALDADVDDAPDVRRARGAVQALLDAAHADRSVRPDLSVDDLYLLVSAVPEGQPPEALRRWVDLTLFGIAGTLSRSRRPS